MIPGVNENVKLLRILLKDIYMENTLDKFTGLYPKSNGGTEQLYRNLMSKLSDEEKKTQIICSRVRKFDNKKNGKPILWLHDLHTDPETFHLSDAEKRKRFKKLVFVSQWQFNSYAIKYGLFPSETRIIPNCVDDYCFELKKDTKWKDKSSVRLVYHTTPHRGLDILYEVFDYLCKNKYPNGEIHLDVFSSFEVYGWKERDEEYKELFDKLKNHPNITYHGTKPHHEVLYHIATYNHIFAYPNTWLETSCLSMMEAMILNTIPVCPDLGALAETTGRNAIMYPFTEVKNDHAGYFVQALDFAIQSVINEKENALKLMREMAMLTVAVNNKWEKRIPEWKGLIIHDSP